MKKTSKIFGAIAVSAALALGTAVPAFATDAPSAVTDTDGKYTAKVTDLGYDEDRDFVDGTAGETPVYIDVNKSNLNVSVPIELRLVAESAGGALICPTNYRVTNYSVNSGVYINEVAVTYNDAVNENGRDWALVQNASEVGEGVESTKAQLGNLMVTIKAPDAQGGADSYVLDVDNPKVPTLAKAWKIGVSNHNVIDGKQIPTGTAFPLAFDENGCKSSIVQDADAANILSQGDGATRTAANAFSVHFTISSAKPKA